MTDPYNPYLSANMMGGAPEIVTVQAGETLEAGIAVAPRDRVVESLKTVYDPEIPVNIYDLGLIYDLDMAENGDVAISMTLTTPACPVAEAIPQWVATAVETVEGVGRIEVRLVWDPPWDRTMMSADAEMALGL